MSGVLNVSCLTSFDVIDDQLTVLPQNQAYLTTFGNVCLIDSFSTRGTDNNYVSPTHLPKEPSLLLCLLDLLSVLSL
jgi:hypothetical protein